MFSLGVLQAVLISHTVSRGQFGMHALKIADAIFALQLKIQNSLQKYEIMASDREHEKTDEMYQSVVPVLPDKYKIARHASHQVLNESRIRTVRGTEQAIKFFSVSLGLVKLSIMTSR